METRRWGPPNTKHGTTEPSNSPTSGCLSGGSATASPLPCVRCSGIYNSHDVETTYVSIHRGAKKDWMLFRQKKKARVPRARAGPNLEGPVLGGVTAEDGARGGHPRRPSLQAPRSRVGAVSTGWSRGEAGRRPGRGAAGDQEAQFRASNLRPGW